MRVNPADNTIVTIGGADYLWGVFLLIASARKAGMTEPFLVGCRGFSPCARRVLEQFGDVSFVALDGTARSLACSKPFVMRQARTDFVTWADSDAFFTGNVSALLPPDPPDAIHFRLRAPSERPGAGWMRAFGGAPDRVPPQVLDVWRRDVARVCGAATDAPRFTTTGSSCFCALSCARHRRFLEAWQRLSEQVLPARDVGVTDRSLLHYPQLDESTLNACLAFLPDAPPVQSVFRMDKDRTRLFVHFIAQPKPWQGWTKRAFRFFDEYVSVVEWAAASGLEMPGPVPPSLRRAGRRRARLLAPWTELRPKLARRLAAAFGRNR